MEIAKNILAQLGGAGRLKAMIDARQYVALENKGKHVGGLQFRFKGKGVNLAEIRLNGRDLYDVKFSMVRGYDVYLKRRFNDVYAEDLGDVFRDGAGVAISL